MRRPHPALCAVLVLAPLLARAGANCGSRPLAQGAEPVFSLRGDTPRPTLLSRAGASVTYPRRVVSLRGGIGAGCMEGYDSVPAETWVGTTGMDSCIGVILRWPSGRVLVAHFASGNSPAASLAAYAAHRPQFDPRGATAFVGGGDDSPESNGMLGELLQHLKSRGVSASYVPRDSMAVDANGELAVNITDKQASGWIGSSEPASALERLIRETQESVREEVRRRKSAAQ